MTDSKFDSVTKIESLQSWKQTLQEINKSGICGLVMADMGPDPLIHRIRLIMLAPTENETYVADCIYLGETVLDDLAALLENINIKKIIFDGNSELSFISAFSKRRLKFKNIFDIQLASKLCWSGYYDLAPSKSPKNAWKKRVPDHSLEALAERHLGIHLEKSCPESDWCAGDLDPALIYYFAKRAQVLLSLQAIFQELILKNGLERVAELEFRTISPVIEMELSGICFDSQEAMALIQEKELQLINLFMDLQAEAKASGFRSLNFKGNAQSYYLNPESQDDIKTYLRSQGFDISNTRAEVLRELSRRGCIFAEELLRYRNISHDLAFLDSWLQKRNPTDGKIHSSYYQLKSSTGRLSSCRPNAQQIPRKGEDGMAIRRLFRASQGKKIVKADFSAIELRIMAFLSGDETMLKALQEGQDLHKLTASKVSGLPLEEVTAEQRQAAKTINFLLIYGGSAETLQWRALSDYGAIMSLDEAEEARNKFFETYSGIKAWQENQIAENSYTTQHYFHNCIYGLFSLPLTCTFTALGRRRVWPRFGLGIKASKFQLFNTPCQGTGADLIKLVMCELYDHLDCEEARIIASIHDEIILEVPEDKAEEYAKMLGEVMNRVGSELLYPVPVTSQTEILSSWGG